MDFIEKIIDRVKKNEKKKIVLPETDDIRTLEAAAIAIRENIADIYLIGKEEDILSLAKKNNIFLENPFQRANIERTFHISGNTGIAYFHEIERS